MVFKMREFNFAYNIFSREKISIKLNEWEYVNIQNKKMLSRYYHLFSILSKAISAILGVVLYDKPVIILIFYIIISSFWVCAYIFIN
jgi:hypothetical protein